VLVVTAVLVATPPPQKDGLELTQPSNARSTQWLRQASLYRHDQP
jgi:hypothetical protein